MAIANRIALIVSAGSFRNLKKHQEGWSSSSSALSTAPPPLVPRDASSPEPIGVTNFALCVPSTETTSRARRTKYYVSNKWRTARSSTKEQTAPAANSASR